MAWAILVFFRTIKTASFRWRSSLVMWPAGVSRRTTPIVSTGSGIHIMVMPINPR
jgi:hypothetical protein